MKKILSHWQGLTGLVAAVMCFILSGYGLRWVDEGCGIFDVGYLQRPLLAAAFFFFANFVVWIKFQADMPSIDEWIDEGGFKKDWERIAPMQRIAVTLFCLAGLMAAFLFCMWLVPTS